MDRGVTVHRVTKNLTRLKRLRTHAQYVTGTVLQLIISNLCPQHEGTFFII